MIQPDKRNTGFPFSDETDRERLSAIFRDTLVIDTRDRVLFASKNLLDVLEYSADEIHGGALRRITSDRSLLKVVQLAFEGQSFVAADYLLTSKSGQQRVFGVEGVKVGHKGGNGERLMLRAKPQRRSPSPKVLGESETMEHFIYQAAHDLRGPLATIKGLVNLLKMRTSAEDVDKLVHLIDVHANALDERLFQLSYLNQSYDEKETPTYRLRFSTMETRLRKILEKNAFVDFLELHFNSTVDSLTGIDETMVYRLAEHLLLHMVSLPMDMDRSVVCFHIEQCDGNIVMDIAGQGFGTCSAQYKIVSQNGFSYTDVFQHPELMNLFSAKKLVVRMEARIEFINSGADTQHIRVRFPATPAGSSDCSENLPT